MLLRNFLFFAATSAWFLTPIHAQSDKPQLAPCAAQPTDDPGIPGYELTFSGKVRTGEGYQCELVHGLAFHLIPNPYGWRIEVHDGRHEENLAIWSHLLAELTPDAPGPEEINVLDSLAYVKTGEGSPKRLPEEHKFIFSPDDQRSSAKVLARDELIKRITASGNGVLKVVELRTPDTAKPETVEMLFDVDVHVMAVDGFPVYRAGGEVGWPKITYRVDPSYSEQARRAKVQGTVVLSVIVDREGHPRNIRVIRSLGSGLDEQATAAVQNWKFDPATRFGEVVPVQINVETKFHLYNDRP